MPPKVKVTTNNDIAYIWWSVPKKVVGCLGFSIHREIEGEAPTPLPAWVGFEKVNSPAGAPKKPKDTDVWPIQSFQWKDVFAPRIDRFRYHIYVVRGTPRNRCAIRFRSSPRPSRRSTSTWGRCAWCSIGGCSPRRP